MGAGAESRLSEEEGDRLGLLLQRGITPLDGESRGDDIMSFTLVGGWVGGWVGLFLGVRR